jgi:hypothetical protein
MVNCCNYSPAVTNYTNFDEWARIFVFNSLEFV